MWCTSQARTRSTVSGGGLTSSATCSLVRYAPYLKRTGERKYRREQRSSEVDVPWMPRVADLGEGVSQGSLLFGYECDVEVYHLPGVRVSQTLPVGGSVIPGMLDPHLIPMYGGRHEFGE